MVNENSEEDRKVKRLTTRIFVLGSLILVVSGLMTSYCTGKDRQLAEEMVKKYQSMEEKHSTD